MEGGRARESERERVRARARARGEGEERGAVLETSTTTEIGTATAERQRRVRARQRHAGALPFTPTLFPCALLPPPLERSQLWARGCQHRPQVSSRFPSAVTFKPTQSSHTEYRPGQVCMLTGCRAGAVVRREFARRWSTRIWAALSAEMRARVAWNVSAIILL